MYRRYHFVAYTVGIIFSYVPSALLFRERCCTLFGYTILYRFLYPFQPFTISVLCQPYPILYPFQHALFLYYFQHTHQFVPFLARTIFVLFSACTTFFIPFSACAPICTLLFRVRRTSEPFSRVRIPTFFFYLAPLHSFCPPVHISINPIDINIIYFVLFTTTFWHEPFFFFFLFWFPQDLGGMRNSHSSAIFRSSFGQLADLQVGGSLLICRRRCFCCCWWWCWCCRWCW